MRTNNTAKIALLFTKTHWELQGKRLPNNVISSRDRVWEQYEQVVEKRREHLMREQVGQVKTAGETEP